MRRSIRTRRVPARARRSSISPPLIDRRLRFDAVRLAGNIIWFVLAGFWLFVGYVFAALLCFVFIVTIPFGVASLRIALFGSGRLAAP